MTLLGTRLGGGIVGVPSSAKNMGYVTIQVIQVFLVFISMFSKWMLMQTREITGISSLPGLGMHLYGNWSIYLVNSLIALAQFGFPIIFFIVFGDAASSLIIRINSDAHSFWTSKAFTHIILAIVMLYLVLKKEIHQLRYASVVLFFGIILFVFLLFIHFLTSDPDPEPKEDITDTKVDIKFFASLPTVIASYAFNSSYFTAFGTLKNKTKANGLTAGFSAIIVAFLVYLVTPLLAFGLYGANVESNLLINIGEENDALAIILEVMFLFIAIIHIPIIFFIGKEAVLIMFDEATRQSYSKHAIHKVGELNKEKKESAAVAPDQNQSEEVKHEGGGESSGHDMIVKEDKQQPEKPQKLEQSEKPQESEQPEIPQESEQPLQSETTKEAPPAIPVVINPKEYLNMKPIYYYVITIACYSLVVILSIVIKDVTVLFGFIGSTASSWVIIAAPGSFYILSIHKYDVKLTT